MVAISEGKKLIDSISNFPYSKKASDDHVDEVVLPFLM